MPDDIIKEARERFQDSQDGTEYNRRAALEDIRFARLAEQWPDDVKKQREQEGRPCLTINKLPAFIRQVVNEARQNKAAVKVHPVDGGADKDTAEVLEGLVRSIWRNGIGGDVATDTAIDHAVSGGFGFFRVGIDYAHDETFDLECHIERVPNPLMVHWDPNTTEFDSSDWEYAFVSDMLSKEMFEARYPKASAVSWDNPDSHMRNWVQEIEGVRVAEYWQRTEKKRKLLLMSDGSIIRADQFEGETKAISEVLGLTVAREREVRYHDVTRRIISGYEELEEAEPWPGSTIPICPVWGDEVMIDGRRYFRSMVRDARDPQNMFNFWRTASTELVALAPKAPFIGEEGFVPPGQEHKWASANTRSHAYLEFTRGMSMPQRQTFAGVPAGALQEALNASDDIKAIIGIYDTSLGARSNETSGRAILARQREADVSNFHFLDNLSRAIQSAGKIIVEIAPYVYTQRDAIRILGEDMTEKVIRLSNGTEGAEPVDPETGDRLLYDLSVGKYDVTVSTGPSYASQREETRETLIEIMRAVPGAAQFIGDILMEHLDFQGADKVAERLKMLLPPNIQAAEGIQQPQMMPQGMPGQPPAAPAPNPGPTPGEPPGPFPQGGIPGF